MRAEFDRLKSKPCADCKKRYPPYVMDFDHLGSKKKTAAVSALLRRSAYKQALAEVKKCELVCANCHRIRTFKRPLSSAG